MPSFLFDLPPVPSIPVEGRDETYPVRRIFCVGRNYVEHAREMGAEVDREAPFYFTKSPAALALGGQALPYPPGTENLQHEVELVVALGRPVFRADPEQARAAIFGYAVGLDMTRRDLQLASRAKQRPWDTGKDFENAAILGPITPVGALGPLGARRIHLTLNGVVRQDARLDDLVWGVEALIQHLSTLYHLGPGDLLFSGTPAGVGPVSVGDTLVGAIEGLAPVELHIGA